MNILTRRLIGLFAAFAAAAYFIFVHAAAFETWFKDQKKDNKKEDTQN